MFILFHLTRFKLETIVSDMFQTRVQLLNWQLGIGPRTGFRIGPRTGFRIGPQTGER